MSYMNIFLCALNIISNSLLCQMQSGVTSLYPKCAMFPSVLVLDVVWPCQCPVSSHTLHLSEVPNTIWPCLCYILDVIWISLSQMQSSPICPKCNLGPILSHILLHFFGFPKYLVFQLKIPKAIFKMSLGPNLILQNRLIRLGVKHTASHPTQ